VIVTSQLYERGNPLLAVTYTVLSVAGTQYFNFQYSGGHFVAGWLIRGAGRAR